MDDLISRQAAIDALMDAIDDVGILDGEDIKVVFDNLPSAQPERKKGKWIEYVNSHCECPFCHKEWSFFENMTEWFNFCPNCGAELEGSDAEIH